MTEAAYQYDNKDEMIRERISSKTLCLIGEQGRGAYRQYDVHSLYGWKQAEVSLRSVNQIRGQVSQLYQGAATGQSVGSHVNLTP